MLTPAHLHGYQQRAIEHVLEHPRSLLFLDPGLGKTIVALTAVDRLRYDSFEVSGVLIVAPLRVCQSVWRQEAAKWEQTRHLRFSFITGSRDERIRGLMTPADCYLINYDNLVWLQAEVEHRFLSRGNYPPWNMCIFDELSMMKNTRIRQGAKRGVAALKLLQYCPFRIGLTGSPAANGLQDLFGQLLVIDSGERLGTSFTDFRATYFYQVGYSGYQWAPFESTPDQVSNRIADITLNLSAEDYLDLPDMMVNDVKLDFPPVLREQYDSIEREMLVELKSGRDVEIFNKASLLNRCLQFAGGGVYLAPGAPEWEHVHDIKLDAMVDLVEELAGKPVLVLYEFQHEALRIQKRFPGALWISSKTSEADFNQAITDWNAGKLSMIIGHPASMGHGVDRLQNSCHTLLWYGLPWSLDLYMQTCKRIHRQGQQHPVMCHRLMIANTVDELVSTALELKETSETEIRNLIENYARQKETS